MNNNKKNISLDLLELYDENLKKWVLDQISKSDINLTEDRIKELIEEANELIII